MKIKLFFLFVIFVFVDQISKYFLHNSICNPNIAWSIPISPAVFYFVWSSIVAVLIYIFFKTKNHAQKIFLILILTGAASNIIDRIRLGCVIDYIDIRIFPIFNLADVYIILGAILIVLYIARKNNTKY